MKSITLMAWKYWLSLVTNSKNKNLVNFFIITIINMYISTIIGNSKEIMDFASKFGVTFPIFSKIDVNGPHAHPLFTFLKKGVDVQWNFEKFLCDSRGISYSSLHLLNASFSSFSFFFCCLYDLFSISL